MSRPRFARRKNFGAMPTAQAQEALFETLGNRSFHVAQIGPAGERLSLISSIMHDINRAAGRTGLGAVMGSKRLKAVVVRGTGKLPVADSKAVSELARFIRRTYLTPGRSICTTRGLPAEWQCP